MSTATIRNYTDMELHGSIIFAKELDEFPANPRRNEQVLIDGVLWIYSMVQGLLTWFPLNSKKSAHTHVQSSASDDWSIEHDFGTQDFIIGIYGPDGNLMYPSQITDITDDTFHVKFTEPTTGRLVAFFNSELFVPAVSADSVKTNELYVAGGAVFADENGLTINGNPVLPLNSQGYADYGLIQ